jgi:hypothetical protein
MKSELIKIQADLKDIVRRGGDKRLNRSIANLQKLIDKNPNSNNPNRETITV